MQNLKPIGIIAGILAAAGILTAIVTFSVTTVGAQNFDCITEQFEYVTAVNPFTGEQVSIKQRGTEYDEDCNRLRDGRVNINDAAAGAAIWCDSDGIRVYDLDISGNGTFVFHANWNEVRAVPQLPETNTIIDGTPGGIALYRLTTGEMQVNAFTEDFPPRTYTFIWDGCEAPIVE